MNEFTTGQFFDTILMIPKTLQLIFRLEKKYAYSLILLNIITSLAPLATLFIYQELINSILTPGDRVFNILLVYIFLQIAIALLNQMITFSKEKFNLRLSYSLNIKLMRKTSSLDLADYEQADMYNLIENITQDSTYKPFQLFNAIIGVISSFIALLTSIIYINTWSFGFSIFLLIIPILSLFIFLRVGQLEFLVQWRRAHEERESWYISYLLTHDFSFKEIKLNNISNYLINKYARLKEMFISQDLSISRKKLYFNSCLDVGLSIINATAILMMIISIRAGKLLLGNFVSLVQALTRINTNSQSMVQDIYIIYNTSLFMDQLFDFLGEEVPVTSLSKSSGKMIDVKTISISKLTYQYSNSDSRALDSISLEIKNGELIAIVGKNGSGKSTLVKILAGLYHPTEGEICYNNLSNKVLSLDFYQNNIAVLFQDFVKYELSLRENVGLSNLNELNNDDKMEKTLDSLKLDFLKTNGIYNLDMQLGSWFQDGRQLSGGQWQKVALSRTFYKEASVYILDEPSSALDPISEKKFFDDFVKLSEGKISIFVSHSLSAAKKADRIIVMKDGRVESEGSHEELMRSSSYYNELYHSEMYEDYSYE